MKIKKLALLSLMCTAFLSFPTYANNTDTAEITSKAQIGTETIAPMATRTLLYEITSLNHVTPYTSVRWKPDTEYIKLGVYVPELKQYGFDYYVDKQLVTGNWKTVYTGNCPPGRYCEIYQTIPVTSGTYHRVRIVSRGTTYHQMRVFVNTHNSPY